MTGRDQLRELMARLRPYLKTYLETRGLKPNRVGKYKCINPHHEDKTPSANLVPPDETTLYCFGCSGAYDLFHCVSTLEGRAADGPEFVTDNVHYLADMFNVPYEPIELTPDDFYRLKIRKLYGQAKQILSGYKNEGIIKDLYGWRLADVSKWGIGTVDSWKDFLERLSQATGCSKTFINNAGIAAHQFNEHVVTFAIHDQHGQVIGFGSRDSRFVEGKDRYTKWVNTPSTSIYSKSHALYGIDAARHYSQVYIFEGYGDVIEARLQGMLNCAALCGTAFTAGQVALLKSLGKTEIILCGDTDDNGEGQAAVERTVDQHFSGTEVFKVGIVEIPANGSSADPRDYIREHGILEFKALPVKDVFTWRMDKFPEDADAADVCAAMLPLVLNEPRHYRREGHLQRLHRRTKIRLRALHRDYETLLRARNDTRKNQLVREAQTMVDRLHDPDVRDTQAVIQASYLRIQRIENQDRGIDDLSVVETLDFLDKLKRDFADRPPGLLGWHTGFDHWDKNIEGMPKSECIVSIAALENLGKSSIVAHLGWNIVNHPENKNVVVLIMTIDDSRAQFVPRFLSIETELPLNTVKAPQNHTFTTEQAGALDQAWKKLKQLVRDKRLDVKDVSHGADIGFAIRWIDRVKQDNPDAQILFCLDNFHKLTGGGGESEKQRIDYNSEQMDMASKQYQMTWLITQEMRKHDPGYATSQDLLGSSQLGYDNNITVIMDQEMHRRPDSGLSWTHPSSPAEALPVNQLWFEKNKVSGWKGREFVKFWPDRSKFFEQTQEERDRPFCK